MISFANPWGLTALAALPVIVVLHMYHRRFPPLMIAGLHLWSMQTVTHDAGRRRERLPITASLLLELLAALLLALLLAEPRFGDTRKATYLVVVLDNSASMSAMTAEGQSFRDLAIEELQRRFARFEPGSVITVILTGSRPTLLAGPAVTWEDAKTALDAWHPSAPHHDFFSAWDVAAGHAEELGQLLFLTDHLPDKDAPIPQQMEIVSVGRRLDNVAITSAHWTFDSKETHGHLYFRLVNLGAAQADVTVVGRSRDRDIFRRSVTLDAGKATPLETDVPGGLGQLMIDVQGVGDALPIDSSIVLVEPKARLLTTSITLPANTAAYRATERVLKAIPDVQFGQPATAHLVIGAASQLPPSRSNLWWLGIGPLNTSQAAIDGSRTLAGPYLLEKQNALLEGLVWGGVVCGGVQPLTMDASPLISAGRTPLLARLSGTQTTGFILNLDLARSNLADSPDWPILLSNLAELRRNELPGLRRWNYRLNETIHFRLDEANASGQSELKLVHAEGTRALARTRTVEVPPLRRTGVYTIQDGDKSVGQFAVNFDDVDESNLQALLPGTRPSATPDQTGQLTLDHRDSWLILLGLLLVTTAALLNWVVLRPKRAATAKP